MSQPQGEPSTLEHNVDISMSSPSKEERELPNPPAMVRGQVPSQDSTHVSRDGMMLDETELKQRLSTAYVLKDKLDFTGTLKSMHELIYTQFLQCLKDDSKLRKSLLPPGEYRKRVNFEDVHEALLTAFVKDDWLPYMNLGVLRTKITQRITPEQLQATFKSWSMDYTDQGVLQAFRKHVITTILQPLKNRFRRPLYARLIALIQSSGVGKSRLADEMAKMILQINVNLRSNTNGFPLPDVDVRHFLIGDDTDTPILAYVKFLAFLFAAFSRTLKALKAFPKDHSLGIPERFRSFLAEGQSANSVGPNRKAFYAEIIAEAIQIVNNFSKWTLRASSEVEALEKQMQNALLGLLCYTAPNLTNKQLLARVEPILYIVFDEAHVLCKPFLGETTSRFTELRRALAKIVNYPTLAVVISTTGAISSLNPATRYESSARVQEGQQILLPPWCTLGFDHFLTQSDINSVSTLKEVVTFRFASKFGRPLWNTRYESGNDTVRQDLMSFARMKLLMEDPPEKLTEAHHFALLSQRMPIELGFSGYTSRQNNLVENHLRICLDVRPDAETMVTVSASEPILSEAASTYMRSPGFSMAKALQDVLTGYSISQGDRGELISAAILTQARDAVVQKQTEASLETLPTFTVADFMSALLGERFLDCEPSQFHPSSHPSDSPKSLRDTFSKSAMHFNHFIKPHEQEIGTNRLNLLSFIIRGAAVQSAGNQPGWDKLIMFLYWDDRLQKDNVGFILVQDKNDHSITLSQAGPLFDRMDPFELGLFEDGETPIPIIRLIFSMGREKSQTTQYIRPVDELPPQFTSFDFMCEGLSSKVFPAMKEESAWKTALRMSAVKRLMEKETVVGAKRMYPLGGEGHSLMVTDTSIS